MRRPHRTLRPVARARQGASHDVGGFSARMPRIRQQNVTAAQWSPNGGQLGAVDLTDATNNPFAANVFSVARAAPAAAEGHLQAPPAHARERRGPRAVHRRRRGPGHEGVGARERRHPLHALVPAAHRLDRREARLVLRPRRRRHRDRRLLRLRADPGRARRVVVPDRRRACHVRGARLHRLGSHQPRLHPREPQRRAAVHPHRVRLVDRRGARRQDPAAALDGRALEVRDPRAAPARRRASPSACSPRSAPSRSTS